MKKPKSSVITKETCQEFRERLEQALEEIQEEMDIFADIKIGTMQFDGKFLRTKLEAHAQVVDEESGKTKSTDQLNWERNCKRMGFVPSDWMKSVKIQGKAFQLCTIESKARTKIVLLNENHERRICNADVVLRAMGKNTKKDNDEEWCRRNGFESVKQWKEWCDEKGY
jgi:uncharacterized protein (UPF0335 family)